MKTSVFKGEGKKINLARTLQLWLDSLGQLLAKFYTPLIVGVDVPDHLEIVVQYTQLPNVSKAYPLGEDLVLIHGNESSKSERVDLVNHDAVGWPVASELLVGGNPLNLGAALAGLLQFGLHLKGQGKVEGNLSGR